MRELLTRCTEEGVHAYVCTFMKIYFEGKQERIFKPTLDMGCGDRRPDAQSYSSSSSLSSITAAATTTTTLTTATTTQKVPRIPKAFPAWNKRPAQLAKERAHPFANHIKACAYLIGAA